MVLDRICWSMLYQTRKSSLVFKCKVKNLTSCRCGVEPRAVLAKILFCYFLKCILVLETYKIFGFMKAFSTYWRFFLSVVNVSGSFLSGENESVQITFFPWFDNNKKEEVTTRKPLQNIDLQLPERKKIVVRSRNKLLLLWELLWIG